MSKSIFLRCCTSLRQAYLSQQHILPSTRACSSEHQPKDALDIKAFLSKPNWSVRSLLPDSLMQPTQEITLKQLNHLLRLSALPQPKSPKENAEMLKVLHSQLHFVRDIQKVDTEGLVPLQSIRDETREGIEEATIRIEDLKDAFEAEEIKKRSRRPRRKMRGPIDTSAEEGWDVLGTAGETVNTPGGSFFVVRSGKE